MGQRAMELFDNFDIQIVTGVNSTFNYVIEEFIKGVLKSGESLCKPGVGKGYGLDKEECDHPDQDSHKC